jgi:hypothetical protein
MKTPVQMRRSTFVITVDRPLASASPPLQSDDAHDRNQEKQEFEGARSPVRGKTEKAFKEIHGMVQAMPLQELQSGWQINHLLLFLSIAQMKGNDQGHEFLRN